MDCEVVYRLIAMRFTSGTTRQKHPPSYPASDTTPFLKPSSNITYHILTAGAAIRSHRRNSCQQFMMSNSRSIPWNSRPVHSESSISNSETANQELHSWLQRQDCAVRAITFTLSSVTYHGLACISCSSNESSSNGHPNSVYNVHLAIDIDDFLAVSFHCCQRFGDTNLELRHCYQTPGIVAPRAATRTSIGGATAPLRHTTGIWARRSYWG